MATTTTLQTGAEEIHWDLSHLYSGDPKGGIEADLSQAQELAQGFETSYRGKVAGLDAAAMADALRRVEEIQEILGRAASYAFLDFSTDVADPVRGALMQKVQESMTQTGTQLLFFSLEWLAVPDVPGTGSSKKSPPRSGSSGATERPAWSRRLPSSNRATRKSAGPPPRRSPTRFEAACRCASSSSIPS